MGALAVFAAFILTLGLAGDAWSLTAEEIIRLKKAGVSEGTIQLMIQQEQKGAVQAGPAKETRDEVVYSAGEGLRQQRNQNKAHERWKEKKALDAAGNVIIDQRRVPPPPGGK